MGLSLTPLSSHVLNKHSNRIVHRHTCAKASDRQNSPPTRLHPGSPRILIKKSGLFATTRLDRKRKKSAPGRILRLGTNPVFQNIHFIVGWFGILGARCSFLCRGDSLRHMSLRRNRYLFPFILRSGFLFSPNGFGGTQPLIHLYSFKKKRARGFGQIKGLLHATNEDTWR